MSCKMYKSFKIIILLVFFSILCGTMCLLAGCGETYLEKITLTVDKTEVDVGETINLSVSISPTNATLSHRGLTYDKSCISIYVRINGVDTLVGKNMTTYTINKVENICFWAKYCDHRHNSEIHYDTKGDLVSELVDVNIKTTAISTVDDLKSIANTNKAYILSNDIDLTKEKNWKPIENFSGRLDGAGHTISSFVLSDNSDNLGFFNTLNGTITNTNFSDVVINPQNSKSNFGVVAGTNKGSIINCTINGTIDSKGANNVGGIVGNNDKSGLIKNCTNYASVNAGDYVGGIVGKSTGNLVSCLNEGTIVGDSYVGGIAGDFSGSANTVENKGEILASGNRVGGIFGNAIGEAKDYKNSANIESKGDYVGGLVGYNEAGASGSNNTGNVSGKYYVGGFYGYNKCDMSNYINNVIVTGRAYVGGIVGQTTNLLKNCENYGNVLATGTITENGIAFSYIGGLAGYSGTIENCKNTVDITGVGAHVGGLAGFVNGEIKLSENIGNLKGKNETGGLAGSSTGSIVENINHGRVQGEDYTGGLVGYFTGKKVDNSNNDGEVVGKNYTAGLIAYAEYYCEMNFSENSADITGYNYVGGYVGYAKNQTTINYVTNNSTISGKGYVGGIVGYGANTKVSNCENYGEIISSSTVIENSVAYSYVGGLAGYCSSIDNSKNTVNIEGLGARVGGLAGYASGSVSNSENSGNILGKDYTGGLTGYIIGNIIESTNVGNVTGLNYVGGIAGYITSSKIDSFENDGNIEGMNYVGAFAGYSYNSLEITESKNNANVTGTGQQVGSLLGQVRTNTTIRSTKNTGKVTNGYESFIATYSGTIKGLPYISDATKLDVKESDVITIDLLEIEACDLISKKILDLSLVMYEGKQEPGNIVTYFATVIDDYGNEDVRFFDIRVYGTPVITSTATTISVNSDPTIKGCIVNFDLNGYDGLGPETQLVTHLVPLSYPTIPTREGYAFAGWYDTVDCGGEIYDFSKQVSSNLTLYAKWILTDKIILNANEKHTEYISHGNEIIYAFVPLVSEEITIKTSRGSGDLDGYLLNSNQVQLTEDKSSSADVNMKFSVTAGNLYYIKIKAYQNSGNVPIVISCSTPNDGGLVDYEGGAPSCVLSKEILGIIAKDSFGVDITVIQVFLKSGTISTGNYVVYTITTTDKAGNTQTIETQPILVIK